MKKAIVCSIITFVFAIFLTVAFLFQKSKIIYIPDYKETIYNYEIIEISDEELNAYIKKILGNFYTVEPTDRITIQNGDIININYKRFESDLCVSNIENLNVLVGSGGFHASIENFLIGKEIKASYDYYDDLGAQYEITVNEIGDWVEPQLTSDFLQKNFQVDNFEAFKSSMYQKLYSSKKLSKKKNLQDQIINALKDKALFIIVPEDVDNLYATIIADEKCYAEILGFSFESYIVNVKNMSIEEFTEHCYQKAEDRLKELLICEKIWNDMSSEEVEKYLNEFNIESTSSISNSLKQTIVKSYLYDLNLESE